MNLANKLTIGRVVLIPIFMYFLLANTKNSHSIALAIFVLAAITDALDGHVARSRNLITKFGKFMDPLADKLLVSAALIGFTELGLISSWITFIILAREFAITGLRVLAASEGITIAASWWGKIKTISQMTAIIILLSPSNLLLNTNTLIIDTMMLLVTTITIISGIDYIIKNRKVIALQK